MDFNVSALKMDFSKKCSKLMIQYINRFVLSCWFHFFMFYFKIMCLETTNLENLKSVKNEKYANSICESAMRTGFQNFFLFCWIVPRVSAFHLKGFMPNLFLWWAGPNFLRKTWPFGGSKKSINRILCESRETLVNFLPGNGLLVAFCI